MASFCGTQDCINILEDFSSLASGTNATDLITKASAFVSAYINDFHGSLYTEDGTNYPFWVREATAQETVFLAFARRQVPTQETGGAYWDKYHQEAVKILEGIRAGSHVLSTDISPWERGICPAEPATNGTLTPVVNLCFSNSFVEDQWFTGDHPLTFVVELDGTGSRISQQTLKWMYKYGSVWEAEGVQLSQSWIPLSHGVSIRFEDRANFVTGYQWEIACNPSRYSANPADALDSWSMDKAF